MTRFIKKRKEIKPPKKSSQKENSSQINDKIGTEEPCMICGVPATGCISVDIDLPKFYFCKKHDFDVQMYFLMALGGKKDDAESWLKHSIKNANERGTNKKSPSKKGK
jgi:hypothetical protein